MDNANTAIVTDGFFTHYCHTNKGLMMLRVIHHSCPFCNQKNPDYICNKLIYGVTKLSGSNVLMFSDENKAIKYIYDHPKENFVLDTTGYVE